MRRLLLFLLLVSSCFAQQPTTTLFGSGAPGGSVAFKVGTEYIDQSQSPAVLYVCTSVSVAVGPTPPAGTQTCNWTQAGSSVSANNPIPQSQVGPGFNVLNYGAVNDAQSSNNCTLNTSTTQVCTGAGFCNGGSVACAAGQASNVGMEFSCGLISTGAYGAYVPKTTIASVTNATTVVTVAASIATLGGASCSWGTASATNDANITTAVNAWVAAIHGKNSLGILGAPPGPPRLYFPGGGYLVCTLNIGVPTNKDGFVIEGDVLDGAQLIFEPGCTTANASNPINIAGNATNGWIRNLTLNGMGGNQTTANGVAINIAGSNIYVDNVNVQGFNTTGMQASGAVYIRGYQGKNNNNKGFICAGCGGDIDAGIVSNNGQNNLVIQNSNGLPLGGGFRIGRAMLVDETGNAAFPPTLITNSHDVIFDMPQLFSTPSGFALDCDANSHITLMGGSVAVFNNDTNAGGVHIRNGCVLDATNVRFSSTGTGKAIQVDAGGVLRDNGGNSSESMFSIASGTSTGTTVVLTLTTLGANVNANCSVGDGLVVQGAAIAGYDLYSPPNGTIVGTTTGITAVTATTLTYTSVGSNMGALGAGGVASCRNLQTYTGAFPIALLNNPIPNTCHYTITPIANATTVTLCNFKLGSFTNINTIKASSQATTTCATPPLITITDGTATMTLTLTSGKNSWDSSVDTSTGVGTTSFKPGGTITVKYDVAANSACATPATNLSVSYTISPILSN